jgi:hypothetical protein
MGLGALLELRVDRIPQLLAKSKAPAHRFFLSTARFLVAENVTLRDALCRGRAQADWLSGVSGFRSVESGVRGLLFGSKLKRRSKFFG